VANVDHLQFLGTEQAEKFGRDPELIRQLAWFIADKFEDETGRRPEVHAFALASLNGRKPQLMIDPNTDLASVSAGYFGERSWIVPLEEPLRSPPWDVPMNEWRQHVELPEINFLKSEPSSTGGSDAGDRLSDDSKL
jgi:hypothetical protein